MQVLAKYLYTAESRTLILTKYFSTTHSQKYILAKIFLKLIRENNSSRNVKFSLREN